MRSSRESSFRLVAGAAASLPARPRHVPAGTLPPPRDGRFSAVRLNSVRQPATIASTSWRVGAERAGQGPTPLALGACKRSLIPAATSPKRRRGVAGSTPALALGACKRSLIPAATSPKRQRGVVGSTPRWRLGLVATGISDLLQAPSASAGCYPPPRAGAWGLWRSGLTSFTSPKRQRGVVGSTPRWRLGLVKDR